MIDLNTNMVNVGWESQSSLDEEIRKAGKRYFTPDDIEVESDRQNVSIQEINKWICETAKRVEQKEQGENLLINGGEDIKK